MKHNKPKHVCNLPKVEDTVTNSIFYCFGCKKRYILKRREYSVTSKVELYWQRYFGLRNRHKHSRIPDTCSCRCGKYISAYDWAPR